MQHETATSAPAIGARVANAALRSKIMSADEAATLIHNGDNVGMSGFTGSGYPKALPLALARRIEALNGEGSGPFRINVMTGASTAPELDGALAKVKGMDLRLPYQGDPIARDLINSGEMRYIDMHLSHAPQYVEYGFLGKMDVAVIEVAAILEDGRMIPTCSIGNNKTWLDKASKVIIEVNNFFDLRIEGMHDIYYGTAIPPNRKPIPLVGPGDRIGEGYYRFDTSKVVAIVETNAPDRDTKFAAPDDNSNRIAGHILDFFAYEIKHGRLPKNLLPLQSGVGNIANAVLGGLNEGPYENMTAYTEVLQDGMLAMVKSGKLAMASATALSLSHATLKEFMNDIDFYRERIVLRPQEISNHPEIVRRLGTISMNAMLECDIYGNVNSTHVMGTRMMNGIGGSGDFARNAYFTIFMAPSMAKGGAISCVVPMVAHHDHTEHDTMIMVTEQGLADLRGLAPRQRAQAIIERCAHPDYRPALREYVDRAEAYARSGKGGGMQTPHLMDEALSFHARFERSGHMLRD